jgi:hypothetical protein
MHEISVSLAALYLRGGPRPVEARRCAWLDVVKSMRRSGCAADEAGEVFRDAGYWAEALIIESPGLLDWARGQVRGGRVLSAVDGEYPCRWLRVMGSTAPPVLWKLGTVPCCPSISVVGSRMVSPEVARFCFRAAREAVGLGFSVVSGRAEGCDRSAARGARSVGEAIMEILPHGIDLVRHSNSGCLLSVCAPQEQFSTASAMERNALIYAASTHTIVGQARFKEGGTWTGAMQAIRGRYTTLLVRESPDIAMRSLAALGGIWLKSPSDLGAALKSPDRQGQLFGSAV